MSLNIAELDETSLCAWLLRRMRGEEARPRVDILHFETPEDYVVVVYQQTDDDVFRKRLGGALISALRIVAGGDLKGGSDAMAVRNLAYAIRRLGLKEEVGPILCEIAKRGVFGFKGGALDARAESAVLAALAALQMPFILRENWLAVWHCHQPGLWSLAVAGLRHCDPEMSLSILPEVITRSRGNPTFPLGEILWAYRVNPGEELFGKALRELSPHDRDICRGALLMVGANEEQIERLFQ